MLTVFLNLAMFSCSPQSNTDGENPQQLDEPVCCGDDTPIIPPPPTED